MYLLVDVRRGVQPVDAAWIYHLTEENVAHTIVATKVDKEKCFMKSESQLEIEKFDNLANPASDLSIFMSQLKHYCTPLSSPYVLLTSVAKDLGIQTLRLSFARVMWEAMSRHISQGNDVDGDSKK